MMFSIFRTSIRLGLQLLLVVVLAWGLLAFSPLDPVTQYLDGNVFAASAAQKVLLAERLGMSGSGGVPDGVPSGVHWWPVVSQWLANLIRGDMGFSNLYRQPVLDVLWARGQLSLLLMGSSWVLALLVGYVLGLLAGLFSYRWVDSIIRTFAWVLAAIPPFWLGMVMIALFAVKLQWAPACCAAPYHSSFGDQGMASMLLHLVLPMTTLALVYMAPLILHTREKVIDVLADSPVQYARLHGQSVMAQIRFHVVKNSLLPALVLHLACFAELFSGSILAETIFNYPGLGQTLVKAGLANDVALFMGATLISAVLVFVGNMAASLFAAGLTPGVRG